MLELNTTQYYYNRKNGHFITEKAYGTGCSQAVPHPSTIPARRCLTSVIRRERVCSSWYGRRRQTWISNATLSILGQTSVIIKISNNGMIQKRLACPLGRVTKIYHSSKTYHSSYTFFSGFFHWILKGVSADADPHYQKLYGRVTDVCSNRRGQPNQSAMKEPRPERYPSMIRYAFPSGKYAGCGQ